MRVSTKSLLKNISRRDLGAPATLGLVGFAAAATGATLLMRHLGGLEGIRERLRRTPDDMATDSEEVAALFVTDSSDSSAGEASGMDLGEAGHEDGVEGGYLDQRVVSELLRDPELGHRAIDVETVADGAVRLSGFVNNIFEMERATTLASSVPEVNKVINRLIVGSPTAPLADSAQGESEHSWENEERWSGDFPGTGGDLVVVVSEATV